MDTETLVIVPGRQFHREAIKNLLKTIWAEYFGMDENYSLRNYFNDPADIKDIEELDSTYFENGGTFLVIVVNDEVVGSGGIKRLNEHECELTRMFLLANYRGRGLGKEIAQRLFDFAKEKGYSKIHLNSNKKLQNAHLLYQKLGFNIIYEHTNDRYGDAYHMEMIL